MESVSLLFLADNHFLKKTILLQILYDKKYGKLK